MCKRIFSSFSFLLLVVVVVVVVVVVALRECVPHEEEFLEEI